MREPVVLEPGSRRAGRLPAACPACDAVFLTPVEGVACPTCGRAELEAASALVVGEPERVVPFEVEAEGLRAALRAWVEPTPFAVPDLSAERLSARAVRAWWPSWLVDAQVVGQWRAEVGFDYQVQSSQETFAKGRWTSRQITDTRVRWEPRAGQLVRRKENTAGPALRGEQDLHAEAPTAPAELLDGVIRLPELLPDEAWPELQRRLHLRLGRDVQRAASAQHIRELSVRAEYLEQHWTWLLLPVWATWYATEDGRRHLVLVDGRTGQVRGPRYSSVSRGRSWALGIAVSSLFCLCLTLPLALWPLFRPGRWNREQREEGVALPEAGGPDSEE